MELNEKSVKVPKKKPESTPKEIEPPPAFCAALNKNPKAKQYFESMPPSHKREYLGWITEAKKEETRERRIVKTIELLEQGKTKNWKYERVKDTTK
jgi:uncharacterized protein YdeI (YjbR/CyaY-like superfamily)